ncbi:MULTISPECIES: alpha/beta fold hydrolase [Rhodococcus]|uniref:alpha/beta fold hydrolase n=1 Tax=Rhodococcus TaxID=1827 RepID=UPI00163B30F5|nr:MULTISPECIES: alpha/beta hydrolase [Rhodococcus]MBC2587164.1 alpha/beta hydrolase [Rhodococcus aetherivorans]QRI74741.1 alpha/beta hydrolase [Rhodococcus aetherivorans]QSE58151.1 alpha/beta hydrolase [Rhodococcus sp. PSBB066]QSE70527.1 alpha/beta hydrolase [Rhodococcus sp. PSBB049]
MRYDDWGARSPQWAGLRSVSTSVCGVPVHYVRAEPASTAPPDAPVHLLVPPMTGSASMWLDLVPPLRRLGPVISVDLPGTIVGHTGDPYRHGPRADLDARFVAAFARQLRLESQVLLHGWSTGGPVAALAATMMPEKTRGVVLVAPALPWRRTSPAEAFGWQTLGRLVVAAGPPTTRLVLRLAGRRILDAKRTAIEDAGSISGGRTDLLGGNRGRVSRAQVDLWLDDLEAAREHPERLAGTATAFASIVKAMFITQKPTNEALDSVQMPVLVLWGSDDHLVDPTSLMQHARRPGWTPRPIEDVGHLLPVEAPDLYAQAVCQWLSNSLEIPGFGRPT